MGLGILPPWNNTVPAVTHCDNKIIQCMDAGEDAVKIHSIGLEGEGVSFFFLQINQKKPFNIQLTSIKTLCVYSRISVIVSLFVFM